MNKLVSKNPILRFKYGKKIVKALGGLDTFKLLSDTAEKTAERENYWAEEEARKARAAYDRQIKSSGKRLTSFGKAFKEARNSGLREFIYDGRKISTRLAGESNQLWADNLNRNKAKFVRNKAKFVLTPEDLNPGPIPYALENPPVNTPELLQDRISNLNFLKLGGQLSSRNIIERFKIRKGLFGLISALRSKKNKSIKKSKDEFGNDVVTTTIENRGKNPFKTEEIISLEVTYNKENPEYNDTVYTYLPQQYISLNPEYETSNNWKTAGSSLRRSLFERLRNIFNNLNGTPKFKNFR